MPEMIKTSNSKLPAKNEPAVPKMAMAMAISMTLTKKRKRHYSFQIEITEPEEITQEDIDAQFPKKDGDSYLEVSENYQGNYKKEKNPLPIA